MKRKGIGGLLVLGGLAAVAGYLYLKGKSGGASGGAPSPGSLAPGVYSGVPYSKGTSALLGKGAFTTVTNLPGGGKTVVSVSPVSSNFVSTYITPGGTSGTVGGSYVGTTPGGVRLFRG